MTAPLDPDFVPLTLGQKAHDDAVAKLGSEAQTLHWRLPRSDGKGGDGLLCAGYTMKVFPEGHEHYVRVCRRPVACAAG